MKKDDVIKQAILELGVTFEKWAVPWLFDRNGRLVTKKVSKKDKYLPTLFLHDSYDLYQLTHNSWIDDDINRLSPPNIDIKERNESVLGQAFDRKYSKISMDDDARSAIHNWNSEAELALSNLDKTDDKGHLLHIGCDDTFEAASFHQFYSHVTLTDIAENQLRKASSAAPYAQVSHTCAELLDGVSDSSVNSYIALRVFSSAQFNTNMALQQAARVLKENGQILISSCNGYKAIDNTIIPGQIVGSPPKISLSRPFEETIEILILLIEFGFRNLFVLPGSAEIFLGGIYQPLSINEDSYTVTIKGIDHIPFCFYSSLMPTSWIGNYSPHPINIDGISYRTVEHYFQSKKFVDTELSSKILQCYNPEYAKSLAWDNNNKTRSDWDSIKVDIMKCAIESKFIAHSDLLSSLLATNNREIIERTEIDTYWGASSEGIGNNMMGKLLMELRTTYRKKMEI